MTLQDKEVQGGTLVGTVVIAPNQRDKMACVNEKAYV